MKIKHYANNPKHLAELVDLINYCQNIEADLDIKMAEQADIFEIEDYYQKLIKLLVQLHCYHLTRKQLF
ncbi:gnat family acetyltransferase [Listeria marthii FSL S4-120]|uniref:Gnat family acetyltransferase n=1 Tax=Listeria marthii FSL S4-120 TaxID=702457 RepID=A0ABN0C0I1_9LIST|nr:gnat family acetyltransferase [Listeria marthii FSL S4-120]